MKKIISVLLCIILVFSVSAVAFAAERETPVIFVPGYSSSRMFINRGTENEKRIWKIDVADEIIDALKKEIPALLLGAGKAVIGDYSSLFTTLEPYAEQITDYLRINDDGISKYDVEVYPHSVETTRLDKLKEYGYYPDYDTLKLLNKYTDSKNIYCCTLDWRLGQVDNAAVLNEYVDDVLEATNAEKVNLIGVSYGGEVAASYLSLYGGEKVDKAVLHCPALGGSSIPPQLFSDGEVQLAWTDILKLVQTFRAEETDFSEITDVITPDFLNGFIKDFVVYYMFDLFLNFGSAWDLMPTQQYTVLCDKLLRDGKHDALIAKSDKFHFEVASKLKENLGRLRSEGVKISIIAGYGYKLVTDNGMNSDAVIEVASTTGAKCANIGKTLGDSYVAAACDSPSHCHISPDNCIDAATGYLPENTWFVKDMFHGLGTNEKAVADLIGALLFTDEIEDVHSDIRYPQFMTSDNPYTGAFCCFSGCSQGVFTPYSTELTVTNLSKESSMKVDGISASGADLKFSFDAGKTLAPGESMTAKVCGKVPEKDLATLSVKVDFIAIKEAYRVAKSRTQDFRFTNGSLYNEVLAEGVGEGTPVISDGKAEISGRTDILSFIARLLYKLRKFISALKQKAI